MTFNFGTLILDKWNRYEKLKFEFEKGRHRRRLFSQKKLADVPNKREPAWRKKSCRCSQGRNENSANSPTSSLRTHLPHTFTNASPKWVLLHLTKTVLFFGIGVFFWVVLHRFAWLVPRVERTTPWLTVFAFIIFTPLKAQTSYFHAVLSAWQSGLVPTWVVFATNTWQLSR